jgi:RNA polymerase sigma-70 factor (ECF subfamily)
MTERAVLEDLPALIVLRDRDAFRALYSATSAKLFGVCLRVLSDRAEAEDALQEVYVKIWHKADRFAVTGHSPMTWLITVARNHAIDRVRQRRGEADALDPEAILADPAAGPEAQAIAAGEARRIVECLEELAPDRAAAVKGAYLDGQSYAALAGRFDVPLNTMRTWLRRSLLTLKDCLSR